jgi:hypothetical protein
MHVTLIGDSVFDNAAYTAGEPSVSEHLTNILAPEGTVSLRAVDGAVTRDVLAQLPGVPPTATRLVVSSGGNDALGYIDLLSEAASGVFEALDRFVEPLARFEKDYRLLLEEVARLATPTHCCTIYNGSFPPSYDGVIPVAASLFNDVIYRLAGEHRFPVIELRRVCTKAEDFVQSIEPSGSGGQKIAQAICDALLDDR